MTNTSTTKLLLLTLSHLLVLHPVCPFLSTKPVHRSSSALFAEKNGIDRREVLTFPFVAYSLGVVSPAEARGLVQFPCTEPLGNTYHFMRSGLSFLEVEDVLSTNPLFVTNREAALSPKGAEQVEASARYLKKNNINPSIIRYAIAASSTDTTNLVARELKVGRDRLVPEFNYLEPRAVGGWDTLDLSKTEKAVWAMDVLEAGDLGLEGRPPPNEDGTPHETLADVAIRLRQLISVLETQYSGDTVLVVACEGTTLALLSCMMAGIPFNRVHELEYRPGEVRLNVTMESTLALLRERQENLGDYNIAIEEGKVELKHLRETADVTAMKDQRLAEEQRAIEAQYRKDQAEKKRKEAEERKAREARAREFEAARRQAAKARLEEASSGASSETDMTSEILGAAGVGAIGILAMGSGESTGESGSTSTTSITEPQEQTPSRPSDLEIEASSEPEEETNVVATPPLYQPTPEERSFDPETDLVATSTQPLEWRVVGDTVQKVNGDRAADFEVEPPIDRAEAAERAMEDYLNKDDGSDDWLQSMSDILYEDDD